MGADPWLAFACRGRSIWAFGGQGEGHRTIAETVRECPTKQRCVHRGCPCVRSEMIGYVVAWAAIGLLVPLALLLLDRFAGAFINASPFGLLFFLWPTSFMIWMASPDWLGLGVAAFSVALNGAIYFGLGRLAWALRSRVRHSRP